MKHYIIKRISIYSFLKMFSFTYYKTLIINRRQKRKSLIARSLQTQGKHKPKKKQAYT